MNKTAIITGTNRGIGKQIITTFAKNGYDIWACARNNNSEFEEYIEDLSYRYNVIIEPVYFDLSDSNSIKNGIKSILCEKKPIDVLVNNAGVAHGGLIQMTSVDDIRDVFDINFFAMVQITQMVFRSMVRNGRGSIINMGSVAGLDLEEGNCAYGVSKAAVMAFTKTAAKEFARYNIRVNAVAPGLTDTTMATMMDKKAGEAMLSRSSLGRLATPEEISNAVLWLASDEASFVTGQTLRVDGGM